ARMPGARAGRRHADLAGSATRGQDFTPRRTAPVTPTGVSSQPPPGPRIAPLCFGAIPEPWRKPIVTKSFFFILRVVLAWLLALILIAIVLDSIPIIGDITPVFLIGCIVLALVITGAFSHLRRVRLIAGDIDRATLSNRQRRQIEIPLEAGEAFDLLDAAIRDLPRTEEVESARDSLQVRAKVQRPEPYGRSVLGKLNPANWFGSLRNQILATVTPGNGTGSVTLICEPESGAWSDWFRVDDGTNLENAEAITRAITRRIGEHRRNEQRASAQTAT